MSNSLTKTDNKLTAQQEQRLRESLPDWAKTSENIGSAVLQANTILGVAYETILKKKFGFTEKDFHQLHQELKGMYPEIKKWEDNGVYPGMLTTMDTIHDIYESSKAIAESRFTTMQLEDKGLIKPTKADIKSITKHK